MNLKKIFTIISGICFLLATILHWLKVDIGVEVLYLIAILLGGFFVLKSALNGLLKSRFLNIDFLVTIAAVGAIYINQLAEAAAVIFFFSLAEAIEDYGVERSKKAVEALIKKSPQTATLKTGEKLKVEDIKIKDIILVRPGDLIPLDGVVKDGESSIDEATITGEPVPKYKQPGDLVFAGTHNQNGYLEIEVTKESKDSTFAKIISLVEQAQKSKAPYQEFIDNFAKYYTPSVVVLALFIAIIPPILFGADFNVWLYKALVLLVIACPCALVISTPISISSAIGGASRKGVLIKGGKYLEALAKVKAVAFDKTKTLTLGEPEVLDVMAFNSHSKEEVIADAAGIEQFSSHPLAKSILDYANKHGISSHTMEQFENIAGKGGKAVCLVCGNLEHYIGNFKLISEKAIASQDVLQQAEKLEKEGKTVVLVAEKENIVGILAISDTIRAESNEAITKLHELGIETAMLTGDNEHAANYVASSLGIKNVFASLLPEEKVTVIEDLKRKYSSVAMVGDGVNDTPSLATSNVGIAIGAGGSDVAIETADVTLMNNNLLNVPFLIRLGRKTLVTIKQNITASLLVKAVFLVLALFGYTRLEFAIGADSGMALLVILNGLKLFNVKG